ncbi:MAG: hypothetical protein K2H86_09545 [Muribaculaceae bacterium]|nr:hypothetical protein [Muribaculaceae bacterium]
MRHLKQEFDKLTIKELIVLMLAVSCMAAAIVAIFLGMFLPPKGEVHSSVLTYFGISSAFCGSLLGISAHYSNELTKFKTQVTDTLDGMRSGQTVSATK